MRIYVSILCLLLLIGCDLFSSEKPSYVSEEDLVGPTWELILIEAGGNTVRASTLPDEVTLKFSSDAASPDSAIEGEGKTFGGIAPCNGYSGSYVAEDGALRINSLLKTSKGCRPESVMDAEEAYISGLGDSESYAVEGRQLRLAFDGGSLVFQTGE